MDADENGASLLAWFRSNGAIIVAICTQAIFGIIWLTKLDERLSVIETRGSPALERVITDLNKIDSRLQEHEAHNSAQDRRLDRADSFAERLLVVEERQRNALVMLGANVAKIDTVIDLVQKHILNEKGAPHP